MSVQTAAAAVVAVVIWGFLFDHKEAKEIVKRGPASTGEVLPLGATITPEGTLTEAMEWAVGQKKFEGGKKYD